MSQTPLNNPFFPCSSQNVVAAMIPFIQSLFIVFLLCFVFSLQGLIRLLFWVFSQTAEQDRHFTETNMKIDTEVAGLKTMLESHKLDTIKYLAGEKWPFENKKNNCLQLCGFFLRKCVKSALGGVQIYYIWMRGRIVENCL